MKISDNMKSIMIVALVVMLPVIIVMIATGCTLPRPATDEEMMNGTSVVGILKMPGAIPNVFVIRDEARHTTCYDNGHGISCIPDQFNKLP